MGGGEPQLADVSEHLVGRSFVYYSEEKRGKYLSETYACLHNDTPLYFNVVLHPKSCLK